MTSGLLSCCEGQFGILLEAWQGNREASAGEVVDAVSLSSFHRDIVIPINFQEASSPFEALNSEFVSSCQKDMRPPVKMGQGPRVCSRVSTGDSDSPSPCEMKDKPAFKSLQGNTALF